MKLDWIYQGSEPPYRFHSNNCIVDVNDIVVIFKKQRGTNAAALTEKKKNWTCPGINYTFCSTFVVSAFLKLIECYLFNMVINVFSGNIYSIQKNLSNFIVS